jgi:alanine racemase
MNGTTKNPPARPAWVEVDVARLRRNVRLIRGELAAPTKLLAVVKDEAYGHGAIAAARIALEEGAWGLGVSTLDESAALREAGITAPLLLLGRRQPEELAWCLEHNVTICLDDAEGAREMARAAATAGKVAPVHVKLNTGMNRYGQRWDEAAALFELILVEKSLRLEGVMTHFAQSDESDKTFANAQMARFDETVQALAKKGIAPLCQHLCNSGGFLDLPQAHRDMVRVGILLHGVYPSSVCRRLPGIEPVMSVKARIAAIQNLRAGDVVGYGMRYTAPGPRRIAVLPLGYGDGFPRVRNQGEVLLHGRRAPLVGGVTMDAIMVDVTDIPQAQLWDEAVLMGRQGSEEITVHDLARLKGSVSYDILTGWRMRMRRRFVNGDESSI